MNSIRAKITFLTVSAIVAAMILSTLISTAAMKQYGDSTSRQMLSLLCETGEKILDSSFESVEQSVEVVASFVESDLRATGGPDPVRLKDHIRRADEIFQKAAIRTHGILTYYYRIDPAVSTTEKGFWYIRSDDGIFREHEVTDITLYDTEDTSRLVWFTVPKATGNPIWLPPYITDNLDMRVISYNVPIYWNGTFVGVAGIEMNYADITEQTDSIRLYENGFAFLTNADGELVYHPFIDTAQRAEGSLPPVPAAVRRDAPVVKYTFDGVKKRAVWLPLHNGMRLFVTVPVSEINSGWHRMISVNVTVSVLLLAVFVILTLKFSDEITAPLRRITEAAMQINRGNYDFAVDYRGNDEVGILSHAFRQLTDHLKTFIRDLSDRAYADALTSVHNKGALDIYVREMEAEMRDSGGTPCYAVGVFDCDNLKFINDQYGHEKGDIYLQNASAMICRVFQHSPVFRTGGDEFTVILRNDDFWNREELARRFEAMSAEACSAAAAQWEQVRVSMGIATFDPLDDHFVGDVIRRADKLMYENKHQRKAARRDSFPSAAAAESRIGG